MSVVVGVVLTLGGYALGFLAAGVLIAGTMRDLRRLLAMLLDHPDDENVRDLVRDVLGSD